MSETVVVECLHNSNYIFILSSKAIIALCLIDLSKTVSLAFELSNCGHM